MTWASRTSVGVLSAVFLVSAANGQVGIGDAESVVFYGDALVHPPGFGYMVESFVRVKYPKSKARFWHVAVPEPGYAKIQVANQHFDELVAPLEPSVVVLCWGLGDGELKRHRPSRVATVADEFEKLLDRCLTLGAKVYVLTPPLPTVSKKNIFMLTSYDQTIGKIGEAMAGVAEKKGAQVLDWFGALTDLQRERPGADLTAVDGLAPSPLSQAVAANLIMRAWKLDPIDVAVNMDWTAQTVSTTHGSVDLTKVSDVRVRLTLHDFPMPFHTGTHNAALREDFPCAKFCRIILRIDNLPDGEVFLSESSSRRKPRAIPSQKLGSGYNLAIDSPLATNGAVTKLTELIEKKNKAFGAVLSFRRTLVAKPPQPEHLQSYKTHLLSREQYHQGSVKIIQRTPRTVNMSIEVRLAVAGSAP